MRNQIKDVKLPKFSEFSIQNLLQAIPPNSPAFLYLPDYEMATALYTIDKDFLSHILGTMFPDWMNKIIRDSYALRTERRMQQSEEVTVAP